MSAEDRFQAAFAQALELLATWPAFAKEVGLR